MSHAPVSSVEGDSVVGQDPPHDRGKTNRAALNEHVKVVGHERPSVDTSAGLRNDGGKSLKEVQPIRISQEDVHPFEAADHNVVKGPFGIQSRSAWHGRYIR
jgi:hypothetical protein